MQYELINFNHHQNNLALFKCEKNKVSKYHKISLSEKSNILIENEKNGYSWFFNKLDKKDNSRLYKNYYYEIIVPEFKGSLFSSDAIITGNEKIILKFISFYRRLWFSKNNFSIHGDLALCNVIKQNDDQFMIIDWEHFHFADFDYFGYDIVNLLFISLHHEFKGITKINDRILLFINGCFKTLFKDIPSQNKIINSPFKNSSKYLKKFESKYRLNVPIENKFIISRYNFDQLEKLDCSIKY